MSGSVNPKNVYVFIKEMASYKSVIDDLILQKQELIGKAPAGTLRVIKNRKSYQYYQRSDVNDREGTYIPRKDHAVAEALAQKDYDIKLLKALENQQKAIEHFLKYFDPASAARVYEDLTEARKNLVQPEFLNDADFVRQWLDEPYEKLGFGKDEPEYYTARGERVRSKSEILIADALYRHDIPYRYEYPVYSHGVLIAAPDFNCLNVRLRREYYWEHLGMMGNEEYADRNVKKIGKYTLADDFDESRLILTMETDKKPINMKVIEEKIRRFLL